MVGRDRLYLCATPVVHYLESSNAQVRKDWSRAGDEPRCCVSAFNTIFCDADPIDSGVPGQVSSLPSRLHTSPAETLGRTLHVKIALPQDISEDAANKPRHIRPPRHLDIRRAGRHHHGGLSPLLPPPFQAAQRASASAEHSEDKQPV